MADHNSDVELYGDQRNTSRFFVENRQFAWVVLIVSLLWGVYGYVNMPKRKDPKFPVLISAALCPWPGVSSDQVEQLVTRKLEQKIAENARVQKIQSISRGSMSVVIITLEDNVTEPAEQWDDIALKLDTIDDLPEGAGPIVYLKDFGATAALMLTVASPQAADVEIAWRAERIREAIEQARATVPHAQPGARSAGVICFPLSIEPEIPRHNRDTFLAFAKENGVGRDLIPIDGPGFVGVDGDFGPDDQTILEFVQTFFRERLRPSELHPDSWPLALVRDPATTEESLAAVAGAKYSYRELDDFTDLVQRTLLTVPLVSKVTRAGVLPERIFLDYSQERLASYGLQPSALQQILGARNMTYPGGLLEVGGKNLLIDPTGEFSSEDEIGDVVVGASPAGAPVYLRDAVDILRAYESPPLYLNYYRWRGPDGQWHRTPAITLAVEMREGQQIAEFGEQIDVALADVSGRLPEDLIVARTSDQPLQVEENVGLFMESLYEAIVLVLLVALIGFWEWRSAVVIAVSIPTALALTFGMMQILGLDIQQVSVASLIIALGMLVDDPVVASDAIKREMTQGHSRRFAAWLGPTKLSAAMMYTTVTNIVAFLPMLLIEGNTGEFIYSLPVVLACSLIASRFVSMTFIPLMGYYLLKPGKKPEESPTTLPRQEGAFASFYRGLLEFGLDHRRSVLLASLLILAAGGYFLANLRQQFFPKDLSYLSFVDVWLPEDSTIAATDQTARYCEEVIQQVAREYGRQFPGEDGNPRDVLASLTTFVGGGGPRFWFSVAPELFQPNYAQIIIRLNDKYDTERLAGPLQQALSANIPGARVDVRQLETGQPVGIPVQIRISGEDAATLRNLAEQVKQIVREAPVATRVRDDWGAETFSVSLKVDPDRASLAGITNLDVALSSASGMSGLPVGVLREGDDEIPIVARLRTEERAQLSDVESLYVYSVSGPQKVPLKQVSDIEYGMETEKIQRRNQFRTITVAAFPVPGALPSEVMAQVRQGLTEFEKTLPPGYRLEIGGEEEEQIKGFQQLTIVLVVSVVLIFLSLVFQFRHAAKPFIVFAAVPYGVVGGIAALTLMGTPFGFMAFLGIASLIGVLVSHVIVLFDFIEDAQGQGRPLREALVEAGVNRIRPVLIAVGSTIIALLPLALNGGPLWEPMCYAQIGGLTFANFVTLGLVPVIYAFFVDDLKLVQWEKPSEEA